MHLDVTTLTHSEDKLVWRFGGKDFDFSINIVWHSVREVGNVVDWFHIVWFPSAIPRYAFLV